ncbi:MAG: DUF2267 domain-containing protein [Cyclobacteriaceae bacterium]
MKDPRQYQPHVIYLDRIILPIAKEIGKPNDTEYVLNQVRSILSSVSRRLPLAQAVQLFNALPIPLQALMIEEWVVDQYLPERLTSLDNLLEEIIRNEPSLFNKDEGLQQALSLIMAIIGVSANHITPEALQQLLGVFPSDLRERFEAYNLLHHRNSLSDNIN